MSSPQFSVIVCTYNRPTLLARALGSVLAQTFSDFEVIVVDDHSDQEVEEVVRSFADPRLRCLRQPENRGVASSANLGLQAARGVYVSFLNDDDCFTPDFLAQMSKHLQETKVDFAWCGIVDRSEDQPEVFERVVKLTHHQDPWAVEELLTRVGMGYGFTIRTERLRLVGGLDEKLRSCEDTELFLRLVQQPWTWQSIPACLVEVFRQKERLTRPSPRRAYDVGYVLEKHGDFFQAHPALASHFRLLLASLYVEFGDRPKGRQVLLSLLRLSPGSLKVWALLLANEVGLGGALLNGYRTARAWLSRSRLTGILEAVTRRRSAGGASSDSRPAPHQH